MLLKMLPRILLEQKFIIQVLPTSFQQLHFLEVSSLSFVVNGSATLATAGTHYFWLVYDLSPGGTAINGNTIDAQCTSINVGGTPRTPSVTNPAGSRTISTNLYYSIAAGNWDNATSVWSTTSGGPACSCAPTAGNGLVYVNHAIALATSRTVDRVIIENGGVLSNTASNTLTVTNGLNTNGTGYFTATSSWTFNGNTRFLAQAHQHLL